MLKAVFFDMDGTITRPFLDFQALRQAVGVPAGQPIMAHIESLQGAARHRAETVLADAEYQAALQAELNPGAGELLAGLRARGIRQVLITNNHRRAMEHIVSRFRLRLDLLLSREDAPAKPAPDLILLALHRLDLQPGDVCFVGDGRFDQQASIAAGVRYMHLSNGGSTTPDVPGTPTIACLAELWRHLPVASPGPLPS